MTTVGGTAPSHPPGYGIIDPMPHASENDVFSEDEYRADAGRVVAHAIKTGRAVVVRADRSTRIVISIPAPELDKPPSDVIPASELDNSHSQHYRTCARIEEMVLAYELAELGLTENGEASPPAHPGTVPQPQVSSPGKPEDPDA